MSGEKRICLTFDDGPSEYTENLLDGLAERNAKASFFLIGNRVEKYRKTVLRMKEEGHTIGQHTQNHKDLTQISIQEAREEIRSANEAIMQITGERPVFIRPPYGEYSDEVVLDTDMVFVRWSYSSKDWQFQYPVFICKRIVYNAFDGAIVLAHDTYSTTVEGVLMAVDELRRQGYLLVSLEEMIKYRGYEPMIRRVYSRF
ncbi:MAG: hypothetical protein E7188_03085 [Erysipelotrichaceae bacterium]|nr:hypothetical protein [Erysipelotrichaceae bacterium]